MVTSAPFGPFDPLAPCNLSGLFAKNLMADPVEIDAPPELVWTIMIDFGRYPEWNPLNRRFRLDGEARPGHSVTFEAVWGPYDLSEDATLPERGSHQNETLTIWEENCCLAYSVVSLPFDAERVQHISPLDGGGTRYQTFERTDGLLSPIIRAVYGRRILEGFEANGRALKVRAERLVAEAGGSDPR
ncbi:MAG: SRPBCC domain-containing protein [Deltaproteobacteria bacterium]|nr:SRPBCC domain-containing protein [Deltaproteobacteria bacterium]